jgi:hypothetical protein
VTEERPEGRDESDRSDGPDTGDDGLEAQRGSDTDAPFRGLRSAADIFGAPLTEDDWPSRRERREAERAARQAGQPEPEPFTAPASVPVPASAVAPASAPDADADAHDADADEHDPGAGDARPRDARPTLDDAATQAISMPEELALPGGVAGRVPPPAVVPPVPNAPDPRAISLPTARSDRDVRAAESKAIEDERRRTDPDGLGRQDVDWLGRARPAATPADQGVLPPAFAGGPDARPLGVEDVLPSTSEPPTFTELLRLHDEDGAPTADRAFDWAVLGEATGEVPTALTSDAFDTNLVAADSWAAGSGRPDEDTAVPVDDAPTPDVLTPGVPAPGVAGAPASDAAPASHAGAASTPDTVDERRTPSGSSWSLSDEAARTGEVFPGDVTDDRAAVFGAMRTAPDTSAPDTTAPRDDAWPTAPAGPGVRDLEDRDPEDRDLDDDVAPTAAFAPRSVAVTPPTPSVLPSDAVPWWDEEASRTGPTDAAPSRPTRDDDGPGDDGRADDGFGTPRALAPEDIDQSEWQGRETSDTGVIKDLFGTEAIDQIRGLPEDTSTRMMPAVPAADRGGAPRADAGGASGADRDNFINEGFARLQSEGKRGKQLLVYGSIAIIVVLLVLVLLLTNWILGNTIDEHPPAPSSTPAAASVQVGSLPSVDR